MVSLCINYAGGINYLPFHTRYVEISAIIGNPNPAGNLSLEPLYADLNENAIICGIRASIFFNKSFFIHIEDVKKEKKK